MLIQAVNVQIAVNPAAANQLFQRSLPTVPQCSWPFAHKMDELFKAPGLAGGVVAEQGLDDPFLAVSPRPLVSWILVGSPQQGHWCGITASIEKLPRSRFSSTWGMIMFRLLTRIRQPGANSRSSMKDRLCRLALDTSHPSISTGSKMATGAISPVRPGVHSIV